eukprot:313013-Prorocentrum_minimum.AAC.1
MPPPLTQLVRGVILPMARRRFGAFWLSRSVRTGEGEADQEGAVALYEGGGRRPFDGLGADGRDGVRRHRREHLRRGGDVTGTRGGDGTGAGAQVVGAGAERTLWASGRMLRVPVRRLLVLRGRYGHQGGWYRRRRAGCWCCVDVMGVRADGTGAGVQ